MEKSSVIPVVTPEEVWASLLESDRQRKENERYLNEKFAETDRLFKESNANFDRKMAESRVEAEKSHAEFDRKMAESRADAERSRAEFDREMAESKAEFDRKIAESRAEAERSRAEFDRKMEESRAEAERRTKEAEQRTKEADRRMKDLEKAMGGWANNHGSFAEEYFFNAFEKGEKNFFGEHFDDIEKNVKGINTGFKDEYDILMINGQSVCIVETKFTAQEKDLSKVIRKAETFRVNFSSFKNHKVYLGLASLSFHSDLEKKCKEEGIVIIKQAGETVVIHDKHLKVF